MISAGISLDDEQLRRFRDDGFFIADDLFDREEMDLLRKITTANRRWDRQVARRRDGQGGAITLSVHNELNNGIAVAFVRCRRIVDTMERLPEAEVYNYQHNMIKYIGRRKWDSLATSHL